MAEAPRLFKTEAIVLRHRPLGEADRLLVLLSPTHGKLEAKAKGVRRAKSRMGGHLQPLTRVLVQLAQGHVRYVVAGCQTLESFPALQADLDRLGMGLYACELADRFLPLGAEAYPAYTALLDCLRWLERGIVPALGLRRFEARLLRLSGFGPELDRCLACGSRADGGGAFSPLAGGVLCPSCARSQGGARPLSPGALEALRLLQRGTSGQVSRLRLPPALAREVELHLRAYIAHLLEGDARTAGFLDHLQRDPLAAGQEV
ncbi:MAG: DNA repair protein RecO [Dehalococcoidia bacterium]|jgi:DNA repair protein RecO (recombination protein O)|nr:DNA repair protein RecO [Dehalococcoidia bacterium]